MGTESPVKWDNSLEREQVDISRSYRDTYRASVEDPEAFWLEAARAVDWTSAPTRALDDSAAPLYRWFPDGELNTCFNAVDRHVRDGRGDQPAVIYDSAVGGPSRTITYRELLAEVERFAGVLAAKGVYKGDRVVIYLPMIAEAVVAMLACARIGAIHSVVFGGFAAKELAIRIDDARPKLLVTATGGKEPSRYVEYLPLVERALAMASHPVSHVVVKRRPEIQAAEVVPAGPAKWHDWDEEMAAAEPQPPVPVKATDPLYILYTSGTTGVPKGVVRDNGGHAVAMTWSMNAIYDLQPGEVMFTGSDVGWVVGHSYIVYAPLLIGATTVLYEGKPVGTPDAGAFWRIIEQYGVKNLFTAPTAMRAIRREDPTAAELANYDVSSLVTVFLAGERLDPDTYEWTAAKLGVPVVDHWWQTETGWAICANPRGIEHLPIKPGSPSVPVPGYQVEIVDGSGEPMPAGEEGSIVIKLPMPPGTLQTLWGNDDHYHSSYLVHFPGYYLTGDAGYVDEDGYLFVMGRTDDVINVAGHRLSIGSIEAAIATHPEVAECAVVAVPDALKGQVPAGYVVLSAGSPIDEATLTKELVRIVREQVGALVSFHLVTIVPALPKTRSGKILRKTMRQIVAGEAYTVPATIEDASVLTSLQETVDRKAAGN